MKRIMVTGASGLLGRAIMGVLGESGEFELRGTAFSRAGDTLDKLDLCDNAAVRAYVSDLRPDIIIHAAAERRPDVSEKDPDATERLNIGATRTMAECARETGAWLVYISTDYLFDGTTPPYYPDSPTCPMNFYGRSKLAGEEVVREVLPDGCALRVPILYGPIESLEESSVTMVARAVIESQGNELALDDWQVRYPTLTDDVAVVLLGMARHRLQQPDFGGILQWSADEAMSKYTMGKAMAEVLGLPTDNLVPSTGTPQGAPRPRDCRLDCSELDALCIGQRTPFRQAIASTLEPFKHALTQG